MQRFFSTLVAVCLVTVSVPSIACAWKTLETGLDYERFSPKSSSGNLVVVRALRIDPEFFELKLMNASNLQDQVRRSARAWGKDFSLLATINASMYQEDRRTSVSLMKTRKHTNNAYVSKDQCILAFDPRKSKIPSITLIDRQCDDFEKLRHDYGTLVQSIRMISCKGKNVWSKQARKASIAAIGLDESGRVLFLHLSTPQTTYDFIQLLQKLPLALKGAMYLEGSAPAQMSVNHAKLQLEVAGTWCSDSAEPDERAFALPIPNIIGVVRK